MSETSKLQQELSQLKGSADALFSDDLGKVLLRSAIVALVILSIVMITFSLVLKFYSILSGTPVDDLVLNMSIEFTGSLVIFVTLGFYLDKSGPFARLLVLPGLIVFSSVAIWLAFVNGIVPLERISGESRKSEVFVQEIMINLGPELLGSIIIFVILEQASRKLQERSKNERGLLIQIEGILEKYAAAEEEST